MSQALSPRVFLQDLIAFKSISGSPNTPIIDYLEAWALKLGFRCERIEHPHDPHRANLLCWIGPPQEGGLMLSAHTDVVPVSGQCWESDPFILYEKNDKLYGRGTADMKGFIAAVCCALSSFDFKRLAKPLSILFTYDEEIGCKGSALCAPLLRTILPSMPEAALIGEPTDFAIIRMHAGHLTLKISAKGKGAHSSDPALGVSAIKALHKVMSGLFKLEEDLKNEVSLAEFFARPYVTLNVGIINGGSAVNIIPDEASILIGIRPLPDSSIQKIMGRINQITQAVSKDSGAQIFVVQEDLAPAMITKTNTRLEQILRPYAREHKLKSVAFATDAGNLSQEGIECLIFGPGTINSAHQANEFIEKVALDQASYLISQIIEKYLT
jgi:acetylornithine deacetylase